MIYVKKIIQILVLIRINYMKNNSKEISVNDQWIKLFKLAVAKVI